ncbi:MAG: 5-dehydro-4-deoxy-D-glucuronate isomerase [Bacteroidales bacterium]
MTTNYQIRYSSHPNDVKHYDTQKLREHFLASNIFVANEINLVYSHFDRFIVGGIFPVSEKLKLESIDPIRSNYFTERREIGIVNVGGKGKVTVGSQIFDLDYKEALYIGRGNKDVVFESVSSEKPAKFYLNSTTAHAVYPCKKVGKVDAEVVELGTSEMANHRIINKLIVQSVLPTCQLQLGMTELKPGSVWNTMPPHVHDRRMEVYFYFEVPENQAVCHFMGEINETRHLWLGNEEAVISPDWSIHSAAATSNYTFIWGMAGENLDYGDMDAHKTTDLK